MHLSAEKLPQADKINGIPNSSLVRKKSDKEASKKYKGFGSSILESILGSNVVVDDELLSQLLEMGYDIQQAKKALKRNENDMIKTLDELNSLESKKEEEKDESKFTLIDRKIVR